MTDSPDFNTTGAPEMARQQELTASGITLERHRVLTDVPEITIMEPGEVTTGTDSPPTCPTLTWDYRCAPTPEPQWHYGQTRIVLQARDPLWLHTYWEIAQDTMDDLFTRLGLNNWNGSRVGLRVHDVTSVQFNGSNGWSYTDIPIPPFAEDWFIEVSNGDRDYCVDLGLFTACSDFHVIARSNVVRTPRIGPSDIYDEEWLTIKELEYVASIGANPYAASPGLVITTEWERQIAGGSGAVGEVSSPGIRLEAGHARAYWLVADAELVVFGATEPGSEITIEGQPVKVNSDGTFSTRYSLPDGDRSIIISALSHDGIMHRSLGFAITKKTT